MIEYIQLIRNVGKFDSVNPGPQLPFEKLTLLYAENARGKTTLASILRSLSNGDPNLVIERRRLNATQPPHIVIKTSATAPVIFQNGGWSATLPEIAIFDDAFVTQNVCSGIDIETEHKQNLHEFILGAQGVALNVALQGLIAKIEEHNREIRARGDQIPPMLRGSYSIDAFCALQSNPQIAEELQNAERNLAAAQSADAIRKEMGFDPLALPAFDVPAIEALLKQDLPGLDAKAAGYVQAHLSAIGGHAEAWVNDGMHRISSASGGDVCPFCAQSLITSTIIDHYRSYFSESYEILKAEIAKQISTIKSAHGGDIPAAFERAVRVMEQRRQFWKEFVAVPDISLDTAEIARAWKTARDAVLMDLAKKQSSPLDAATLSAQVLEKIASYEEYRETIAQVSNSLIECNAAIELIKEKAATADVAALTTDLVKLKAAEARFSSEVAPLCQAYLDEKQEKSNTEELRDQARAALDNYRTRIFPAYEDAINAYLDKFNAGFRLANVSSVNTRGGSSCTYSVVINTVPVVLTPAAVGKPSFRNTLSAGDRNAHALAFFFASLDQDPGIAQKIVVVDDPMTSLDEHRSLTTVQEVRRLVNRVNQLIVLSHSKPFLCRIWEGADKLGRGAIKIVRDRDGSETV
jgi:wobble nucleotide-excising tRNase